MICRNCGGEIPNGAKFCTYCGAPTDAAVSAPQQGAWAQPQRQAPAQAPWPAPRQQSPAAPVQVQPFQGQGYANQGQQYARQGQNPWAGQQQGYGAAGANGYPPRAGMHSAGYGAPAAGTVDFIQAIRLYFLNYTNFTGRSGRSEFWWATLFSFLVSMALLVLSQGSSLLSVLSTVVSLGFFLPSLSLCIRRLHDIGKPWTWFLMGMIPLAGPVILIIYYCRPSDAENRWGPGPGRSWN